MAMNNDTEELMSLIFGETSSQNKNSGDDETVLDWVEEDLHSSVEHKINDVSVSSSNESALLSKRSYLRIIEED